MTKRRVGVLISGRGSNLQALLRAAEDPSYPATICVVISNRPDAPGLDLARQSGVPTLTIDHRPFRTDRQAHERAIDAALRDHGAEIVALAGYMRLMTPWLVAQWRGYMLNIHPSLLPAFPGLHTHARAIEAGATRHGCTVHLVTETMDAGPVLGQAEVPILPNDTEATLAARVLQQEHLLYPRVLRGFIEVLPLPSEAAGP